MLGLNRLQLFVRNSSGFTLLETVVAISILTMGLGLVGTSVFQVLSASQFWQEDVAATKDLRHAGSWLAGDALNTKATDLIDSAPPADTVMLTTFTGDEITYSVDVNNKLMRSFDDGVTVTAIPVATEVVSASFFQLVDVLTFTLEVTADNGGTKTTILNTQLR